MHNQVSSKRVSVVVATYSAERINHVMSCVNSLERQTFPPMEIILVLDPVRDLLEFYKRVLPSAVTIISAKAPGLSNARNAGVRLAKGEIVAFIDDDAFAHDNWLGNLVENYRDARVVGVGGSIRPAWIDARPFWFPEEIDWVVGCTYKGLPSRGSYVRNPIGCNMSFRKSIFNTVGYFSPRVGRFRSSLLAAEEADFSLRVLANHPESKIVYDASAVVYHRVPKTRASLRYVVKRSFYEGISKAMIRHVGSASLDTLSTEESYLKYLLGHAIPSRLSQMNLSNFCQVIVLLSSIISVLSGYTYERAIELL